MLTKDLVTFITPIYAKNNYDLLFLEEAIQGMKKQTDEKWQAILIDDCSPMTEVRDLLNRHAKDDPRINVVVLDSRKTTGMCRNIGIQWASKTNSSIILFNDADDVSHPERVATVKYLFDNNPESVVVYSGLKVIDENSIPVLREKISEPIQEILESIEKGPPHGANCWYSLGLVAGYTNITSSTAVRTELAVKEPFPDEFVSEDCHTWYRYAAHGDFFFSKEIPTLYRIPSYVVRQSSNSYVDNFNAVKCRVDWDGFSKALEIAESKGEVDPKERPLLETQFLLRLAESMGRDSQFSLAYEVSMQAKEKLNSVLDISNNSIISV